jgi:rsbT antagonist protein RsbS
MGILQENRRPFLERGWGFFATNPLRPQQNLANPMDKIPILKIDDLLLVTIQVDLYDGIASRFKADLVQAIQKTSANGVLIDISAVNIIDSFIGGIIGQVAAMAHVLDAATVVVGMQPAVAITIVELGLPMQSVLYALNVEKGMELLRKKIQEKENGLSEAYDRRIL